MKTAILWNILSLTPLILLLGCNSSNDNPSSTQITHQVRLRDVDYAKAQFFFLDSVYLQQYEDYSERIHVIEPTNELLAIRVYRFSPVVNPLPGAIYAVASAGNLTIQGFWHEMIGSYDYEIDPKLGILKLKNSVPEGDALGVWYYTTEGISYGDITSDTLRLKLLWTPSPKPSDPTWNLELKNIYHLADGVFDSDAIQSLQIYYKTSDLSNGQSAILNTNGYAQSLLSLLHIDESGPSGMPDDVVDLTTGYGYGLDYIDGFIVFPKLRPFDPSKTTLGGFSQELFPTVFAGDTLRKVGEIYDVERTPTNLSHFYDISRFQIEFEYQ